MRLMVIGAREWGNEEIVENVLDNFFEESEDKDVKVMITDCPKGAEKMVKKYCEEGKIPYKEYPLSKYIEKYGAKGAIGGRLGDMMDKLKKRDTLMIFPQAGDRNTSRAISIAQKKGVNLVIV